MKEAIAQALVEDAPQGDITSEYIISPDSVATAELRAREPGIMSGTAVLVEVFNQIDPHVTVNLHIEDAQHFNAGTVLATLSGNAQAILRGERVALNFLQRMCGIATLTSHFVNAVAQTNAKILDTRKTTPGLRMFERMAVIHGGGNNHRFSLSDAVLLKDNHLAVIAGSGKNLTSELLDLRDKLSKGIVIEVEVDRVDQIPAVLDGNVDIIMLDNFSTAQLREGVSIINGRALVEASGGVTIDSVAEIAKTGVDRISVGSLTHSARALDIALDIDIQAPEA